MLDQYASGDRSGLTFAAGSGLFGCVKGGELSDLGSAERYVI